MSNFPLRFTISLLGSIQGVPSGVLGIFHVHPVLSILLQMDLKSTPEVFGFVYKKVTMIAFYSGIPQH